MYYRVFKDDSGKIIGGEYSLACFGVGDPVTSRTTIFGLKIGDHGRISRIEEVPRNGSSNGIMVLWDGRITPDRMKVEELRFILCNDFLSSLSDPNEKDNADSLRR